MTERKLESKILELCTEDAYGLWELLWAARDALGPIEGSEARAEVANVIANLASRGLVALHQRRGSSGTERALSPAEISPCLGDEANWKAPSSDGLQTIVAATPEGATLYFSRSS